MRYDFQFLNNSIFFIVISIFIFLTHFRNVNNSLCFRNVSLLTIPLPIVDLTASLKHNSDAFSKCFTEVGKKSFSIRYHLQISLLILSKLKRINEHLFPQKLSENRWFCGNVRWSRSSLISLNSF